MEKQRNLEKENEKLRNELKQIKENELKTLNYEKTIESLSNRLEKLLK